MPVYGGERDNLERQEYTGTFTEIYSYEIVKKGDGSRYAARVHIKK